MKNGCTGQGEHMNANTPVTYSSERLAYWYFRLNGFLTIENFVVYRERGADQGTDADLVGVRSRHRSENFELPMKDDPVVCQCPTFVNAVLVEVKGGSAQLNKSWEDPTKINVERMLRAFGWVAPDAIDEAAELLRGTGKWSVGDVTIRVILVGDRFYSLKIPKGQWIQWEQIIDFCCDRFKEYATQKSSTGTGRTTANC